MGNDKTLTKAFISYSTKEKEYGAQVKGVLNKYKIYSFLAHEDLEVSEEWKERILEELMECDVFIPLLSKAFKESNWAPQEIGIIFSRNDVPIIPLSIDGTIPFGFISHIQGKQIPFEGITESLLIPALLKKIPRKFIPLMIEKVATATSFRGAEAVLKPIVPLFHELSDNEVALLTQACIENYEVWDAALCKIEYIPEFIRINRDRIDLDKIKALEYQIKHHTSYNAEA